MNRSKPLFAETLIYGFQSPWPFLLLKQFEVSNNTWYKAKIHITAFVSQQEKQRHSHQSPWFPRKPNASEDTEKGGRTEGVIDNCFPAGTSLGTTGHLVLCPGEIHLPLADFCNNLHGTCPAA